MTDPHAGLPYTEDYVAARLGQAGMTLLALPISTRPAGFRSFWPEVQGAVADDTRPAPPSAKRITEMDQALGWIALIPPTEIKLRRLVGARALTSPRTEKPIFSWRLLGEQLGCSHFTAKSWWIDGIGIITLALNRPLYCDQPAFRSGRAAIDAVRQAARDRQRMSGQTRRVLQEA